MTDTTERIRTAFERNAQALRLRPAIGQNTAKTTVCVTEGLTCEVSDGPWRLTADLSEKHGGHDAGPNPGVLGRAALGCCLAMGYARQAALLGIPLGRLEVEIQADYDARGEYGVTDLPPGYTEVRYIVTIESTASEQEILHLLDEADRLTAYLDIFRNPQQVRREVRLLNPTP